MIFVQESMFVENIFYMFCTRAAAKKILIFLQEIVNAYLNQQSFCVILYNERGDGACARFSENDTHHTFPYIII